MTPAILLPGDTTHLPGPWCEPLRAAPSWALDLHAEPTCAPPESCPCAHPDPYQCGHPRTLPPFDEAAARGLSAEEVRRRWPRFWGACPDCGAQVITYASVGHFVAGDW